MSKISTDELISGIQKGQPVSPYPIDEKVIDRHIKLIQQRRLTLDSDSTHAKALKHVAEEATLFVLPGHIVRLVPPLSLLLTIFSISSSTSLSSLPSFFFSSLQVFAQSGFAQCGNTL